MAFAYKNYDSIKYISCGTAFDDFKIAERLFETKKAKLVGAPAWSNLGNYSTAGTSGGSGTTIIAAGDYTWIG